MFADIVTAGGIGRGAKRDVIPIEQVVIRDIDGNALVVCYSVGRQIVVSKHGEPDFPAVLSRLGEKPAQLIRLGG